MYCQYPIEKAGVRHFLNFNYVMEALCETFNRPGKLNVIFDFLTVHVQLNTVILFGRLT